MKIIAAGNSVFDLDRRAAPVLVNFDESYEEIQHAVAQLLDISVLICGALIAVNRNSLMHHVSTEVLFFSQRLHHQLLQILAEQC